MCSTSSAAISERRNALVQPNKMIARSRLSMSRSEEWEDRAIRTFSSLNRVFRSDGEQQSSAIPRTRALTFKLVVGSSRSAARWAERMEAKCRRSVEGFTAFCKRGRSVSDPSCLATFSDIMAADRSISQARYCATVVGVAGNDWKARSPHQEERDFQSAA